MRVLLFVIVTVALALLCWTGLPGGEVGKATSLANGSQAVTAAQQPALARTMAETESGQDAVAAQAWEAIESQRQIRQALRAVAEAYRADMRFPPYSKPLTLNDAALLNPRAYPAVSMPVSAHPAMAARLAPDSYIADVQQPLGVSLVISSTSPIRASQRVARATVVVTGAAGHQVEVALSTEFSGTDVAVMTGAVPPADLQRVGQGDITLTAHIVFADGTRSRALASAMTYQRVATLVAVESAHVVGPHLTIPLRFVVEEAGFYRMQANLFSEQGGAPVAHLSARFELSPDSMRGALQAHVVTLTASGSEGPYRLSDVNLERVPSRPGEPVRYGTALSQSWPVSGFAFEQYSTEEYVDPLAAQRLQFLEAMQ